MKRPYLKQDRLILVAKNLKKVEFFYSAYLNWQQELYQLSWK